MVFKHTLILIHKYFYNYLNYELFMLPAVTIIYFGWFYLMVGYFHIYYNNNILMVIKLPILLK